MGRAGAALLLLIPCTLTTAQTTSPAPRMSTVIADTGIHTVQNLTASYYLHNIYELHRNNYWITLDGTPIECPKRDVCLTRGPYANACTPNNEGFLCNQCAKGYSSRGIGDSCIECQNAAWLKVRSDNYDTITSVFLSAICSAHLVCTADRG